MMSGVEPLLRIASLNEVASQKVSRNVVHYIQRPARICQQNPRYFFAFILCSTVLLVCTQFHVTKFFASKLLIANEVLDFINASNRSKRRFEPILLEPYFLENLLREEERSLLLKHKLMPKIKTNSSLHDEDGFRFITFGLFGNSFEQLKGHSEDFCKLWEGFKCEAVFSQQWKGTDLRKRKSIPKKVASHYFLLKEKTVIHLVVLFKRRHFLRIEALPQNKRKLFGIQIKDRLSFGSKEQAFDSFSLRKVLMPFYNMTVYVPEESDHFLAQMDSSEFIECPPYLNRQGQVLPPLSLSPLALNAEKGLISMKQMMKKLKVPFWLSSGTLLGWYRECGIIGHTTDVDFATWSQFANPEITLKLMTNTNDLRIFYIFGIYEDGYEVSFVSPESLKLDLFYIYRESESKVRLTCHMSWMHSFVYMYYPKFELCSADLLGHKVLVPCNPEALVVAEYGPNWTQPAKEWSYYKSPLNVGLIKKWPYERIQYQQF